MKRKKIVMASSLLALACLASGVGLAIPKNADIVSANAAYSIKTIDEVSLEMKKGASVRYASSSMDSGIRFSVNLSAEDYLGLEANEGNAYKSVSYGMAIMPYSYLESYGDLTVDNLFGSNAKYDWAQWNGSDWVYTGDNTTKKRIICLSYGEMTIDSDDTSKYVFSGSMSDIHNDNLARDFIGRGYIKVVKADGTEEYMMADYTSNNVHNNVRSIVEVAEKAVADPEVTDQSKLDALVNYYLDATNVRYVKFFDGDTLVGTHKTKKNYAITDEVTLGDGFSYWVDEQGNIVSFESGYEIVGITKLYAVYNDAALAVETAQNAIAEFLAMEITQANVVAAQAQYAVVEEAINALRASDYNTYISTEIGNSINAKIAEINNALNNADDLFESFEGVLYGGQSIVDEMSVLDANGNKPMIVSASSFIENGVNYDTSSTGATDWTVYLPKIKYLAYKTVSLSYQASNTWQTFGFINGANITDGNSGALAGTITFTNNGNGTVTCVINDDLKGSISYTITDSEVLNGNKSFALYWNNGAVYRQMSFGPISATSLYNVWAFESTTTISNGCSVSLPQGVLTALELPLINYSMYESVSFDWSVSGWSQVGQGSDLWYYEASSALGGTVTIVNDGDGGLTLTMTEPTLGKSYSKSIKDSEIVHGQKALELHGNSLVNTQSLSIGAITGKIGLGTKTELAIQAGKTPKVSTSVLYSGQGMVDNTSVLDANGNKPMIVSASSFIENGVNYDTSSTGATDWTVYLPKVKYLAYKTVSLSYQASNTWQTFGFINGATIADSNSGTLAGTITFTNNGNGTVTCVINDALKGSISYTITDSEVLNGNKSFGLYWNNGAVYRQMSFGPISATYTVVASPLDEMRVEKKEVPVVAPYVGVSERLVASHISVGCNTDERVALDLPAINYTIYEKVTFNWSSHDWMMLGQGDDLWFDAVGTGGMAGTGTLQITSDGKLQLTLTETAQGKGTRTKVLTDASILYGEKGFSLHCQGFADGRSFAVTDVKLHNGREAVTSGPIEYVLKDFSGSAYETTVYDTDALDRGALLVRKNANGDGTLYMETQNVNGGDSTENTYTISLPWVDFTALNYIRTRITAANGTGIGFTASDMMEVSAYVDLKVEANVVEGVVTSLTATLRNSNGATKTATITDSDVIHGYKGVSFYVKGIQYSAYYLENISANGKSSREVLQMQALDLSAQAGESGYSEYRIAWDANDEWTNDYYNYEFAAQELADFLSRWTGEKYHLVKMYDGSVIERDDKLIVLGGKLAKEAGLSFEGFDKKGDYGIVQDYTNLYIYGESSEATLAGLYGFLKNQAEVTFYTDEVFTENVTEESVFVGAGTSLIVNQSFGGGIAAYAEIQNSSAYQRRLGLYADWNVTAGAALAGAATTWDQSKTTSGHNMLEVFPYETYGSTYSDWYVTVSGTTQLNFTASNTHLQEMKDMFVASAKVVIANMPQIEYFVFGQPDTMYGPDVAGYLAFMNDVAASLNAWLAMEEPDRTVALAMYAYNSTRMAPASGSIYNGDNVYVTVYFAPVGMRYTDKVDANNSYHKDTNENEWDESYTTYEALLSWTKLSGFDKDRNLIYWMYGTDFFNYMLPMDTITNLQYNYQKLHETGTDMIKYQFQTKGVDNVGSDWQRLKTYLASELTKDVNADVARLQENFMNAMYGAGATYMQALLSAQQAYCTYDNFNSKDGMFKSDYTELYFGIINGSAKLMSSTYFSESTLTTWMGYIDNAKAAVNADTKLTDAEKAAYIERIEVEALSIRYMLIKLHNVKKYDASLSAWEEHAASLGCVAVSEG